ncbi:MAG: T9SS type A sorting domain-containing protein [Bacteroidota bacterium]
MRRAHQFASLLFCLLCCIAHTILAQQPAEQGKSQIYFEQNLGQFAAEIQYQAVLNHAQMRFMDHGPSHAMIREIQRPDNSQHLPKYENYRWMGEQEEEYEALVWNTHFVGTSPSIQIEGRYPMPGKINYFIGQDSNRWVRGAERFQELWYEDLYPEIDLRYYGSAEQQVKYDLIVAPGANVSAIQWQYDGVQDIDINATGELEIETLWGVVKEDAPYSYQIIDGEEVEVSLGYRKVSDQILGFEIRGPYEPEVELIIDPVVLNWASYVHSSGSDDYVMATTLDQDDYVYITGYTKSLTFPTTPGVYQDLYGGGIDAFVAKLNPQGNQLVYATYLGGYEWELAYGIGVNAKKEVYLSGFLRSTNYPTTSGSVQPVSGGGLVEGFVSCLSINGDHLIYSTYIGGSDRDYVYDMRVNAIGEAFIVGYTLSSNYPITANAYQTTHQGNGDAFVTKIARDGSSILQSTFVGGSNYDLANGMAVSPSGEVYVVGNTGSTNYPVTAGVFQATMTTAPASAMEDGFISKLSADFSSLQYSSFLGGTGTDGIYCVALNNSGEAFVSGVSYSTDLPVTAGAAQDFGNTALGNGDGFAARITADGSQLRYLTYLGGNDIDFGKSIVVNQFDEAYILGATRSLNFPVGPGSNALGGMYDMFIASVSPDGTNIMDGAFLGGQYNDYPRAAGSLWLKDDDRVTIAGTTHSADIPLTAGSYQSSKANGISDTPWIANVEFGTVLPIQLSPLQGSWDVFAEGVQLNWESENDEGMVWFTIERLLGNQEWKDISQQIGNSQTKEFQYLDREVQAFGEAVAYYRLRYRGLDGIDHYGKMIQVEIPLLQERLFSLQPNPANDFVQVRFIGEAGADYRYEVLDSQGKLQVVRNIGGLSPRRNEHPILNLQDLAPGVYLLRITTATGQSQSEKLIVR